MPSVDLWGPLADVCDPVDAATLAVRDLRVRNTSALGAASPSSDARLYLPGANRQWVRVGSPQPTDWPFSYGLTTTLTWEIDKVGTGEKSENI